MNKEQVYDGEIAPLMHEILRICKRNGIACVASFAIPTPGDDSLAVSSSTPDGNNKRPLQHTLALNILLSGQSKVSEAPQSVLDEASPR